ncbi:MAG TPA: hypothetical protein EYP56_22575, partial [Planctomycetaceae bacterium]|nr:hypothetical protein [Planctomycetaceae bacterium]
HQAALVRRQAAAAGLPLEVHVGRTPELIHLAQCCLAVSGSVSLELLYHTKPTVVLYQISPAGYFVQRFFRKSKYITLVNLLAESDPLAEPVRPFDQRHDEAAQALFPEYLTAGDCSEQIAQHLVRWLADPLERQGRVARLTELKARVARPGASARAARYILERLAEGTTCPLTSRAA